MHQLRRDRRAPSQIAQSTRTSPTGDPYAWTGHYTIDRPYTVNGLNQLVTAGSLGITHDARGGITVRNYGDRCVIPELAPAPRITVPVY
jgi:hypothetical protein